MTVAVGRQLSKYLCIYESLTDFIRRESSETERYLPSERELGLQYGADRLTVRKALDILVRDGLIEKRPGKGTVILPVAEHEAGTAVSRSVAFVLPRGTHSVDRITEPFNAGLFYLIGKELEARGRHLLYATVESDESLPESILGSAAGGIIFVSQIPERTLGETRRHGIPAVLINRLSDHFPMILEDRYRGFRSVLDHVFESGHRRILFINGVAGHFTTETCRDAFSYFMSEHDGLKGKMLPSGWNYESGKAAMAEILGDGGFHPTAVCACNDMVALGAMAAAKEAGIGVPDEMSFAGFDDSEQCTRCTPRLSTVNVNSGLIARIAVDTLFSIITQGNPGPVRTVVPTRFVPRESIRILK